MDNIHTLTAEQFVFWLRGYMYDNPSPKMDDIKKEMDKVGAKEPIYMPTPFIFPPTDVIPSEPYTFPPNTEPYATWNSIDDKFGQPVKNEL